MPVDVAAQSVETDTQTRKCSLFIERLHHWVEQRPDAIALADSTQQQTYKDLWRHASKLATQLVELGVAAGQNVGLASQRSVEAVQAIVALQIIGATYVPLDPTLPEERIRSILNDAQVLLVLTDEFAADRVAWLRNGEDVRELVSISSLATSPNDGVLTQLNAGAFLDHLAYVIYTSGSTGRPKGVPITNSNLAAVLAAWDKVMGDTPRVSLLLSALSFDASVVELFWPLSSGNTLVVADVSTSHLEVGLPHLVTKYGLNHLQITPTRATLLLANDQERQALQAIEHVVIGGEAVPEQLADQLLEAGVQRVTNAYGPTEATVWATVSELPAGRTQRGPIAPVGRPIEGVLTKVVSSDGRDVEPGQQGELVLGGPLVASGYFADPSRSEKSFGAFDFAGTTAHGYRTGDLVVQQVDGNFDFLGRADHQVKIRGHRIELGEIEAVLSSEPNVLQAAVCINPHRTGELVAFLSPKGDLHLAELEARLRTRLPEAMIPSQWVVLERLPQSTSTKVDRVALVALLEQENLAPTTALDSDGLVAIVSNEMATILRKQVPADGDFFALGGNSIDAVELIERLHIQTGIRLPLTALLESSTANEIAELLHKPAEHRNAEVLVRLLGNSARPPENQTSPKPKLFLIHGAGGHVLRFRDLAVELQSDVEVVGVKAVGVDDLNDPDETLERLVDRYTDAISESVTSTATTHPISLGGYSVGGIISIHVAAKLLAKGINVTSLVFIDSYNRNDLCTTNSERIATLLANLKTGLQHNPGTALQDFLAGWRRRSDWDRAGLEAARKLGFRDVYDHLASMTLAGEEPPNVNLPSLLIRSSVENPLRQRSYSFATNSSSSVQHRWVRAKHDELLMAPTVPTIARQISDFLTR